MALVFSSGLPPATGSACTMPVCIDFPPYIFIIFLSLTRYSFISYFYSTYTSTTVHLLEMSNFEILTTMSKLLVLVDNDGKKAR